MSRRARLLAITAFFAAAGCGDWGARRGEVVVDTLANGVVRVRSPEAGVWGEGEAWRLVEEVRIGATDGDGPDVFGDRVLVQADDDGRIYVADSQANEVRVFDADGGHLHSFGRRGEGPGEFGQISGLDWGPDGRLRIMDAGLARLSIFDPDGTFHTSHSRPAGFVMIPWRGRVDREGRVYDVGSATVGDDRRTVLVRFDSALVPMDTFFIPAYEPRAFELTDDAGRRNVSTTVPFAPTQVWHVAADGTVWIGVTDEYRLHQLGFDGDTIRILERPARPAAVTAEERDAALERLGWFAEQGGRIDRSGIPDVRPMFGALFTDDRDHLWVSVGPRDGEDRRPQVDIFDPHGRYLGPVTVPDRFVPVPSPVIRGGQLYAVVRDELDVSWVVRYRISGVGSRTPTAAPPAP